MLDQNCCFCAGESKKIGSHNLKSNVHLRTPDATVSLVSRNTRSGTGLKPGDTAAGRLVFMLVVAASMARLCCLGDGRFDDGRFGADKRLDANGLV